MTVPIADQLEFITNGNGVTREFSYPRRFLQKDEIVVAFRTGDIDTIKSLNVDYSIAGSSWPAGGKIVFNVAPPVGVKVVLYRKTQVKQSVDLENKQRNDAKAVETQLDRLTMALQDTDLLARRALRTDSKEGYRLSAPVPDRVLVWDEQGKAIVPSSKSVHDFETAVASAQAAQAGAEEARDQSVNAKNKAKLSEEASASSAATANSHQSAAALSAGKSAEMAALAGGHAMAAAASEVAAASSMATAKSYKQEAEQSAASAETDRERAELAVSYAAAQASSAEASAQAASTDAHATQIDRIAAADSAASALQSKNSAAVSAAQAAQVLAGMDGGTSGQVLAKLSGNDYDYTWLTLDGIGDMAASVYDPDGKAADVFNMQNMVEAVNAKIMTADERISLAANNSARHTHENKGVLDATTASFSVEEKNKLSGIPADADKTPSLASVATSGRYADLTGRPTLGTAAAQNVSYFATAAQGVKADTAVQPSDLNAVTINRSGSWRDVTSQRSANTSYRNTTGYVLLIAVSFNNTYHDVQLEVSTNGASWVNVYNVRYSGILPILPGQYYRINRAFNEWKEFS
ncbi:hypothetical protein GCM10008943_32510 [Paenochrobactrum glaciei]|uniref:Tail fiber protein n=2 Tax=Paenochrobactrum glaciei TaxID=486407 RepID=A0ABP3RUM1_9HYPH